MTQIKSNKIADRKKDPNNIYAQIKAALENPKYKYRTISGVSAEAHVSIESVQKAIREHADEVVLLFREGKNGETLLTTRSHYKKKASLKDKFMGAVLNRVY